MDLDFNFFSKSYDKKHKIIHKPPLLAHIHMP